MAHLNIVIKSKFFLYYITLNNKWMILTLLSCIRYKEQIEKLSMDFEESSFLKSVPKVLKKLVYLNMRYQQKLPFYPKKNSIPFGQNN